MRYTPSERQAHLDLWRESGLSKAAYCRQADLPYRYLLSWSRQSEPVISDDPGRPGKDDFIEVDRRSISDADTSPEVTVDLGSGRRLTFAACVDPAWAGRLLGAIFGC